MELFRKKKARETLEEILAKHEFDVTRTVYSGSDLPEPLAILMDEKHKKWAVCHGREAEPILYDYADILGCKIYENSGGALEHRAGEAPAGAPGNGTCDFMAVQVTVNHAEFPSVSIPLIVARTKVDSFRYRSAVQTAADIVADFEAMKAGGTAAGSRGAESEASASGPEFAPPEAGNSRKA